MFSHVTVGVSDLDRAGSFYDALLVPLGLARRPVTPDGGPPSLCWHRPGTNLPRFYAYLPFDGQPSSYGNGSMTAFLAPSIEAVELAHAQAMRHGGTDEGHQGHARIMERAISAPICVIPTATSFISCIGLRRRHPVFERQRRRWSACR
ncbi:hypothetical protein [Sphingomonas koreensis]|uniref:hypothetical protein n=1 Tax=Sphingomonas koreensis TaxID=93064 RepID=UPI000CAB4B15|nr:hypothetical protein [Sphingomonas koreensis]PJI87693.1 catechol 2,3-dioxygenase-like lactoylglutathione lyase family enzyme [Sphingomonas koreensis]